MLRYLKAHPETYDLLETRAAALCRRGARGVTVNRVGSMFTFFFTNGPVTDYESPSAATRRALRASSRPLLERGVYLRLRSSKRPSYPAAHTEDDIRRTAEAARQASPLNGAQQARG